MTTHAGHTPRVANRKWTPARARYLLALAPLIPMPSDSLAGQETGDIVRVSGNLTAEFIRSDSTGLHLSTGFVPYGDITSLELKVGTRSRWLEGMLIGGGIGAGIGLVGGLAICAGVDDPVGYCGIAVGFLTGLTSLGGGAVGTLIGAGMRSDRFTPILLPTIGVGMSNSTGARLGLTMGVQLRF